MFLLFLALPRHGWTKPEEPLPPGTLWASIVLAGGLGALLVHLPVLLFSILPLSTTLSHIVSTIMFLWFVFMCAMTLKRGAPFEADLLGSFIHGRTNESFQSWRPKEDMQRDVFLGIFIGWLSWRADPGLIAQGVGAAMLNGGMGILFALLLLIANLLIAGIVILSSDLLLHGEDHSPKSSAVLHQKHLPGSWGLFSYQSASGRPLMES